MKRSVVMCFIFVFGLLPVFGQSNEIKIRIGTIIDLNVNGGGDFEELFTKKGSASGISAMLLLQGPTFGFGVNFVLAEQKYALEISDEPDNLNGSYTGVELLVDFNADIFSLGLSAGSGQYAMRCSDTDCEDGALKDADFPNKTYSSFGLIMGINFGDVYSVYLGYSAIEAGTVKLKQKESDAVKNPQTIEYKASSSATYIGIGFVF